MDHSPTKKSPHRSQNGGKKTAPPGRTGRKRRPRNQKSGGGKGRSFGRGPSRPATRIPSTQTHAPIPDPGERVRVVPIGGVEEVGKNMLAIEYKNDIIISDAGFQFVEEEATPGIDYLLPNTTYLKDRKHKIRALFITHGHLDHIGGIPFIMDQIGNPPIYTRHVSALMIRKRQEEFPHLDPLDIREVTPGDVIQAGDLPVEVFSVTHSIPDSMGLSVRTPMGNIVVSGDLKLDHTDGEPADHEKETWSAIGRQNNLLFIADSTNAENAGFSITERQILDRIKGYIKEAPGRLIIGTFASQFERMIRFIEIAEELGKKVVTEGRSIKSNIEIAEKAGLLKTKKGTIISADEIDQYPANKIVVLATGAQGEEFAALMRMSNKTHKYIRLNKNDTIILSSSVIPGNELSVQKLKDNLYRYDLRIIHYKNSDVHATGHGNQGELAWINKQVGAKYFMPAYGYHSMLRVHAQTIHEENGVPKERIIVPDGNGSIIDFSDIEPPVVQKQRAPSNIVMVDGLSIGDVQEVVIRDRQALAQEGIFLIIATIDTATGKLRKSPDLISRGFVYLRQSQELLHDARNIVRKSVEEAIVGMHPINVDFVKEEVTKTIERFLLQRTGKRPIVITTVLTI